ncbi:MAG: dienelactone hydrolase family protein [Anaerolineae bacterium]|nr:dienelactone hydrolase family protein [Anaerolineae bacterium]
MTEATPSRSRWRNPLRCCCGCNLALLLCGVLAITLVVMWVAEYRNLPVESTRYTLEHDGLTREYRLYVSPDLDPAQPVPLVLVLHGGGGTADDMEKLTRSGFHALADRDGFIVAYPQGIDEHWNDGRPLEDRATQDDIDDVGFIAALIEHLAAEYPLDRTRVYATGISNGGFMSFRLACDLADQIAAVAPVTANLSTDLAARCAPSRPIPVLIVNGTEDPLVRWEGGAIKVLRKTRGDVLSVDETVRAWIALNDCNYTPEITHLPDIDPDDDTRVRRERYVPCAEGTVVELIVVEGGGHTWPGGYQYFPWWLIGHTSRDIDANEVIWAFFQSTTP